MSWFPTVRVVMKNIHKLKFYVQTGCNVNGCPAWKHSAAIKMVLPEWQIRRPPSAGSNSSLFFLTSCLIRKLKLCCDWIKKFQFVLLFMFILPWRRQGGEHSPERSPAKRKKCSRKMVFPKAPFLATISQKCLQIQFSIEFSSKEFPRPTVFFFQTSEN